MTPNSFLHSDLTLIARPANGSWLGMQVNHWKSQILMNLQTRLTVPGTSCNKLRLWVLQIPLPHVPPLILAVMPLASSTDSCYTCCHGTRAPELLILSDKPLCIVSLGSDGSILERDARRALVRSGFADANNPLNPSP
jgi:hypothetical protein